MERLETAAPDVSIVLPTHNRRESLRRTLAAVAGQDYPAGRFELVVVADGCCDGTHELLEEARRTLPFALRWIAQEPAGPAAARNAAIAAAGGEIIAFLDDDVVPVPGWLSVHVRHHVADERAVVIGPLSPGSRSRPAWVRWEDERVQRQYRAMLSGDYCPTPRQFYTGNSSVRRRWLLEVGGFDARLRRAEDVELAFRLQDLGLRFLFDPLADGIHHADRTYESWLAIPGQYGRSDVYMARGQRREHLLRAIGQEFHLRRRSTRQLAQLCLGRPRLSWVAMHALSGVVRGGSRLHLDALSAAACSGVWNLAYWQGLCEAMGGREEFWRLVHRPST